MIGPVGRWEISALKNLVQIHKELIDEEGKGSSDSLAHYRKAHKDFTLKCRDLAEKVEALLSQSSPAPVEPKEPT